MQPTTSLAQNWCQTASDVTTTGLEWNIHYPFLEYPLPSMTSSRFSSGDYCAWTISIGDEDPNINILLHLIRLNRYPKILKPIRVNVKIANTKGHPLFTKTIVVENTIDFPCSLSRISKQDLRESQFYEQDGNCTIYCTIKTWSFKETKSEPCSSKTTSNVCHDDLLLSQIEELFENKVLSDVNLNVGGRIFHVHKNILSARSKVFAAMFEQKTADKVSNNVDIQDVDPDVFQEVLRYLYTGRMSSGTLDKMAVGVLAVADKYLLDQLEAECETHLTKRMSADNCAELLALGVQPHPAMHLKKFAVDFLRRFPDRVMASDRW